MKKHPKFASVVLVISSVLVALCISIAQGGTPPSPLTVIRGVHASLATNCTLYAAPNGNDSNSGTNPTSPKTLNGAAAATSPGSVVCLLGGRYDLGSNQFAPTIAGTNSARITYQAYGDGPATLVWTGTKDSEPMVKIQGTYNGVSFSGPSFLTFQGLNLEGNGLALSGFQCVQSVGVTFIANTIINTDGAGIETTTCDYIVSDHNLIYHNGYSTADSDTSGISYQSAPWADTYTGMHNLITSNIVVGQIDQAVADSDGNGIILDHAYGSNTTTPPTLILNNIVYGNGGRCIITNQNVTNFWIVNNSCFKNALDNKTYNFQEIAQLLSTSMTGMNAFVLNNISYSWTANNPPYDQSNASSSPGITYSKNLYYGAACSPSTLCTGFINGDPQFITPPYFSASLTGQYSMSRPSLPPGPNYETTARCAVTGTQAWIPTCDIDSGFALASTSPAYGNIGVDPTTLTTDPNLKADLQVVVYKDINGNPRGGTTGKWDLGAYQH
jgi:hypothetical protein